jgi:hypothetical protein
MMAWAAASAGFWAGIHCLKPECLDSQLQRQRCILSRSSCLADEAGGADQHVASALMPRAVRNELQRWCG